MVLALISGASLCLWCKNTFKRMRESVPAYLCGRLPHPALVMELTLDEHLLALLWPLVTVPPDANELCALVLLHARLVAVEVRRVKIDRSDGRSYRLREES